MARRDREERRGRDRLSRAGRRRHGAHALYRLCRRRLRREAGHPRLPRSGDARLQPVRAAATTSTRRASRSSRTRWAPRRCAARSMREFEEIKQSGTLQVPQDELRPHRRLFRAARRSRRLPTTMPRQATRDFRELAEDQRRTRIARRAMPSRRFRSSPSAACRAMPAHEQMDALADLMDQFGIERNPRQP